ncbi:hypothetical protein [Candidatus Chlamydia corallus]|uniref:hypothetical protein n=1 Tax=Candidatus Chlamydia corallus TaxID=2038470 RepID=UPI000C2F992A|nr:hypothetical protein [Candidatus Chlamydia corallus]
MAVGGVGGPGTPPPPPPRRRGSKDSSSLGPRENLGEHTISSSGSLAEGDTSVREKQTLLPKDRTPEGASGTAGKSGLSKIWLGVKNFFKKQPSEPKPKEPSSGFPSYIEHGERVPGFDGFEGHYKKKPESPGSPDVFEKETGKSRSKFYFTTEGEPIEDVEEGTSSGTSSGTSLLSRAQEATGKVKRALGRIGKGKHSTSESMPTHPDGSRMHFAEDISTSEYDADTEGSSSSDSLSSSSEGKRIGKSRSKFYFTPEGDPIEDVGDDDHSSGYSWLESEGAELRNRRSKFYFTPEGDPIDNPEEDDRSSVYSWWSDYKDIGKRRSKFYFTPEGDSIDDPEKKGPFPGPSRLSKLQGAAANIKARVKRSPLEKDDRNVQKAARDLRSALKNFEKVSQGRLAPNLTSGVESLLAQIEKSPYEVPVGDLIGSLDDGDAAQKELESFFAAGDVVEYASLDPSALLAPSEGIFSSGGTGVEYATIRFTDTDGTPPPDETGAPTQAEGTSSTVPASRRFWLALRNFVVSIFRAVAAFFRRLASRLNRARLAAAQAIRQCFHRRGDDLEPGDDSVSARVSEWLANQGIATEPGESIPMYELSHLERPDFAEEFDNNPFDGGDRPFSSLSFAINLAMRAGEISERNALLLANREAGSPDDIVVQHALNLARSFSREGQ